MQNQCFSSKQLNASQITNRTDTIDFHRFSRDNSQFRVENRRAHPKIVNVKNCQDQGNMFFSQQANFLNSSQKRHRREVVSQGKFGNFHVQVEVFPEENKDPANFTFYKERSD